MKSKSTKSLMTINLSEMKQWTKNYNQHKHKIQQIETKRKINHTKINQQQERIAELLCKSKETARKFKKQQQDAKRVNQDKRMVYNLIEISKRPRIRSQIKIKLQTIPSRSLSKEKQYFVQQVSQQNKRLAMSIISSATCVKKYKKKIKTQINQYLKLRSHLQKLNPFVQNRSEKERINKKKRLNQLEKFITEKTEYIQRNKTQIQSKLPEIMRDYQRTTQTDSI